MEIYTEKDDEEFGYYEAECQGCEIFARVDDNGLCSECSAMLDRDMLRLRDWDYSVSAYVVAIDKREELRNQVIKEYGKKLELIADEEPKRRKKRDKKKR